jgi:MerR family transcriptional regulator, light-induced transcriptional regulator
MSDELLRIGELSRLVGVPVELLRAWERRYGLVEPARSAGGFRLYGEDDIARLRTMRANLDRGLSAAEAARATLAQPRESSTSTVADDAGELASALERFDEVGAQAVLDRLLATVTLDVVLQRVLIPYLHELGEKWERGEISVAQEHFASNVLRGRLSGLARGWDRGVGPRALLACAEGEQHDLPLLIFGVALRSHGWRISYLGADTPRASLSRAVEALAPAAVVLSGTVPGVFEPLIPELREMAKTVHLFLGGAAASEDVARQTHASCLAGDIVEAAGVVAEHHL